MRATTATSPIRAFDEAALRAVAALCFVLLLAHDFANLASISRISPNFQPQASQLTRTTAIPTETAPAPIISNFPFRIPHFPPNYDAAGNLTSRKDALNRTTSYVCNAFSLVTNIDSPGISPAFVMLDRKWEEIEKFNGSGNRLIPTIQRTDPFRLRVIQAP